MDISTYRGGLPLLHTRTPPGQRGSGFLSTLKRFLVPIGKAVLPSVFGGVSDLMEGRSLGETAKSRGLEVGKRALGAVMNTVFGQQQPAPPPAHKRRRRQQQKGSGGLSKDSLLEKGVNEYKRKRRKGPTTPKVTLTREEDNHNNYYWT